MLRKASKRCQLLGVGSTWLLQQTNSFHSSDAKVGGKRRRTIFGGQQKRAWKLIKLLHTHYHNLHVLELLRAPCCTNSAPFFNISQKEGSLDKPMLEIRKGVQAKKRLRLAYKDSFGVHLSDIRVYFTKFPQIYVFFVVY